MASRHLTDAELAKLAMAGEEHPHVASCATCAAASELLGRLVALLRALPDPPDRLLEAATDFYGRRKSLESLLERLTEEPALRAKARSKPEQVLRDAGIDPLPELVEALKAPGRGSGDLARRIAAKHFWF